MRLFVFFLLLSLTELCFADPVDSKIFYDKMTLHSEYSFFDGVSYVDGNGNRHKVGSFGIYNSLQDTLSKYAESKKYLEEYHKLQFVGNVFYFIGAGLIIGDIVFVMAQRTYSPMTLPIYTGVAVGGLLSMVIGLPFIQHASVFLDNSIWQYNKMVSTVENKPVSKTIPGNINIATLCYRY